MKRTWALGLLLIPILIIAFFSLQKGREHIDDFALLGHDGVKYFMSRSKAKVIVLTGFALGDPRASAWIQRMNALTQKFGVRQVQFFFIDPVQNDERKALIIAAGDTRIPILMDVTQYFTIQLGLKFSGESVIIKSEGGKILYRGDSEDGLESALNDAIGGQASWLFKTAKGLYPLPLQPIEKPDYSQIAPVIRTKCLFCHSGKHPAPLNSHARLVALKDRVRTSVRTGKMPPYNPDPLYGPYFHDISLQPQQARLLMAWLDQGAGNSSAHDPLDGVVMQDSRTESDDWRKNIVYSTQFDKPHKIPPEGELEYTYKQLGGPTPFDMWVDSFHVDVSNPNQMIQVHLRTVSQPIDHYVKIAKREKFDDVCFDSQLYMTGAIGSVEWKDPNSQRVLIWSRPRPQPIRVDPHRKAALFIPKGRYLIAEMVNSATGKPEEAMVRVDLIGSRNREKRWPIYNSLRMAHNIEIPAGDDAHFEETNPIKFPKAVAITNMSVHMHLRGRAFKVVQKYPDGSQKILGSLTDFFETSTTYSHIVPAKPIMLPAGAEVVGVCEYDNSLRNRNNPTPDSKIVFGITKSGSEMCHLRLTYFFTER
jgi:hypothetical protein